MLSRIDESVPQLNAGNIFQFGQFNPPDRFDMVVRDTIPVKGWELSERGGNLFAVSEDVFDRTAHCPGILRFHAQIQVKIIPPE